ncbi:hypothetical protein [Undibacterium sp. TJN19]|uniref:hypothetical protein n=1 Tax=Undibacterium sp. TJN19 TaxID=3413055 RepID=UPI003BF2F079
MTARFPTFLIFAVIAIICHATVAKAADTPPVAPSKDEYANLAGDYRLISETMTKLDGSPFPCAKNRDGSIFECKTVKGKLHIEILPDKSYLFLEASTTKDVGTIGYMGNYQIKQGKIVQAIYTASGLICCDESIKQFKLDGDTLLRYMETTNTKHTSVWKRVGSEEVKDKYLERELAKQRKYYLELRQK